MNITVSPAFKKMTARAIGAIALFIFVYLLLLAFAVGLTVLCCYGALRIVSNSFSLLGIFFALGLASMGFFILFFLLKFLFRRHKADRSHLTEITRQQHPKLFDLVEQVVSETGTRFPRKIYLSADVNAAVFYDSGFWSMFFPVRKNLQIGIGLVNSVTQKEFKAILAHEFGHFSQRSMKVGSYVYHVNHIIFNLLYDNAGYGKVLQGWANIDNFFSIFATVAAKIAQVIQWVLRRMYDVVNLSYLGLSREMEFHADAVAAGVAGALPMKNALLRINFAEHCYQQVLNFYDTKVTGAVKSRNLFSEQWYVMQLLAKESKLAMQQGYPTVTLLDHSRYNRSRLYIQDQWASHPTIEERVKALEQYPDKTDPYADEPAFALFSQPETVGATLTEKLFSAVTYPKEPAGLNLDDFMKEYSERFRMNSFDDYYNGYYDNKNFGNIDVDQPGSPAQTPAGPESLFTKEAVDMIYDLISLQNDKNVVQAIADKQNAVKTFDYDGRKYRSKEAAGLLERLKPEQEKLEGKIAAHDRDVFLYFIGQAEKRGAGNELREKYRQFFAMEKQHDERAAVYMQIAEAINFVQVTTPFSEIEQNFLDLLPLEKRMKTDIEKLLYEPLLKTEIDAATRESLEKYVSKAWTYFSYETYYDESLKVLYDALNGYASILGRYFFMTKKNLLQFQLSLLPGQ
jgi:Zn-dependent protease with chaperone function